MKKEHYPTPLTTRDKVTVQRRLRTISHKILATETPELVNQNIDCHKLDILT